MKNVNRNPLRKVTGKVRRSLGELEINGEMVDIGVWDEVLECGHTQSKREDIYGETSAAKRRCKKCGENTQP